MRIKRRTVVGLMLIAVLAVAASFWVQAGYTAQGFGDSEAQLVQQLETATGGELHIARHAHTGKVRFFGTTPENAVRPTSFASADVSPDDAARAFLKRYGPLFGIADPRAELTVAKEQTLQDGRSFVRYQQVYQNIPVFGGELVVQMKGDGAVISANGEVIPDLAVNIQPTVSAEEAQQEALGRIAKKHGMDVAELNASEPELWIYNPALIDGPGSPVNSLVWRMEITPTELRPMRELVLVDAHLGAVALQFNQIHFAKDRKTYDAQNGSALPGALRRSEGQVATGDADVDNAHNFAGDTYDFFFNNHGRDSLDDGGMTLISTTHYCPDSDNCPYVNAFWDGIQMVYGEGLPVDDVVAHELTHGFTNNTSNLFYYYQAGAINESLSDVWGEFIDLTNGQGTDTPAVRWKLGEDIPSLGVIRDMANPPAYNHPDRLSSFYYYCGESDQGGVHINSGVNNKAVSLMVDGGSFNGYTVNGIGIYKVADLYYRVANNMLTSGSNYADLYDLLIYASQSQGLTNAEQQSIQNALDAVEMNAPPCGRSAEPPMCPSQQQPLYYFHDNLEAPGSGRWTTAATTGTSTWYYPQTNNPFPFLSDLNYGSSGNYHFWGYDQELKAAYHMAMMENILLPANAYLHFHHDWNFEEDYDGGVLEYTTTNGSTWADAGSLFDSNGYNGTISNLFDNPLGGRSGFVYESYGYTTSRLNLNSLTGQFVRFRFRIATDSGYDDYGWFVDDVSIYTCGVDHQLFLPTVPK